MSYSLRLCFIAILLHCYWCSHFGIIFFTQVSFVQFSLKWKFTGMRCHILSLLLEWKIVVNKLVTQFSYNCTTNMILIGFICIFDITLFKTTILNITVSRRLKSPGARLFVANSNKVNITPNLLCEGHLLTHWGRVTQIFVRKLTTNGSDNDLAPGRRQAIIWTNAIVLSIGSLGTNFNEISIKIHRSSFKKMHLKMSSGKWRPFCLGLNVLTILFRTS